MPLNDKPEWMPAAVADGIEEAVDNAVMHYLFENGIPAGMKHSDIDKMADDSIARVYEVIEATCVANENRILVNG